ncbi:MAG: 3-phosphoshikimate 1-carboxyvinyltransferase [Candidatus Omnitrophica bacterium]|nr:3-phosphoshikimate 1-carboxyvinyltransferase [Candidatus Omnitrophota bacterium]
MRFFGLSSGPGLQGEISIPGDKSIAHRAVILSALAQGQTTVKNFPLNEDCLATANAVKKLGIKITLNRASCQATVFGRRLLGLNRPKGAICVKESGTTFRLLLGLLAGQDFGTKLNAGDSLRHRPMLRVIKPLRLMGAQINSKMIGGEEYPPIVIRGANLTAITYRLPVASAQVKSALLLAGLFACGETKVIEPLKTRDHTERMLKLFKADLKVRGNTIIIKGGKELISPRALYIPADISSAAFFMVGANIIPDSRVLIKKVSLNPSRLGVVKVLNKMGAGLKIKRLKLSGRGNEPTGDILASSKILRGVRIKKSEIPSLIDELPILMVAACLAKGVSVFEGVSELRVKETDRIKSMLVNLTKMGAKIKVVKSGKQENIIIKGVKGLRAARVSSFGDHRTAMSMIIAGLAASGETYIDNVTCINKSFPAFLKTLNSLT